MEILGAWHIVVFYIYLPEKYGEYEYEWKWMKMKMKIYIINN